MIFFGLLLMSDVVIVKEPEPSVPPLDRIGWELIGEADPTKATWHYFAPESLRAVPGPDAVFAVTVAEQWSDKNGVRRASNQGYLVNCSSSTVRVDWDYTYYGDHRIMDYRRHKHFRAPVGWEIALVERTCAQE